MNKENTIIAAGGLVKNKENQYLLIYRLGKWDLPKGKLDEGESIPECAVREVMEETGLNNILLGDLIKTSTHHYIYKEKPVEKLTYWYHMEITDNQILIPQTEEYIEKIEWVSINELTTYLADSYDNIVAIFKYLNLIPNK